MNASRASRIDFWIGSVWEPSNVKLLITVRTITPFRMSACAVSRTSS
jgi:hypothetical protein